MQLIKTDSLSTTLDAATATDLLTAGSAGLALEDADVVQLVVSNTGDTNAIDTLALSFSPTGALFSSNATTFTVAASSSKRFLIRGVTGYLRVLGTSTSGTTAAIDLAAFKSGQDLAYQLIVDGRLQGDSAAAEVTGDLTFSGDMNVGGALDVAGATTVVGLTASGDLAAAGGFRQSIGPFYVTTAASQTAVGLKFGDTAGQAWVAPHAGSVTAMSGMIDTAVTGAGTSITARLYKALAADPSSFSLLDAAYDLSFTQAGSELADRATAAKDAHTFAAGDLLKVVYTTDAISNTPKLAVCVEVEC
jgi:hypothetical protein